MLSRVLEMVAGQGWFNTRLPFETTVNLTQGACLWLLLTRGGVCDTYVKFSDSVSLAQEAHRCAAASRSYPKLVPRFVGHLREDGPGGRGWLDVIVCRAVEYRALNVRSLQQSGAQSQVFQDLLQYFAAMPATHLAATLTPIRNADLVPSLSTYFDSYALGTRAKRWLHSEAAQRATELPDMPQHSDLMLNNIGQSPSGAAVVFDWEDFGASGLPGLDLFTLELSLAGDAANLIRGRERHTNPIQQFVRGACQAMQLDFSDYTALTPLYALVFRYLKRNYGPGVRERMDKLLQDLDQQRTMADV